MKVVLFCGGQGLRIRDENSSIPKPMITVGYRPILWHIMRYYASFGHKDFILCLGYRGDVIKRYFLEYDETVSNDFVLQGAARKVDLLGSDIDDWRITFVDTGTTANIGQRLKAVQPHLAGDAVFLANYSDGVTDMPLPDQFAAFEQAKAVGTFLAAQAPSTLHVASYAPDGIVTSFGPMADAGLRVNAGYFVFRQEIFDYLRPGEELVAEPFQRLIAERKLLAYPYSGFWWPMDTFKDRQALEDMYNSGKAPWMVWREGDPTGPDGVD
jgi:glucose-1-phosphate cytidylyltransferase